MTAADLSAEDVGRQVRVSMHNGGSVSGELVSLEHGTWSVRLGLAPDDAGTPPLLVVAPGTVVWVPEVAA